VIRTIVPWSRRVPARGEVETTRPRLIRLEWTRTTLPGAQPLVASSARARASVRPVSLGTTHGSGA
jgi:hypothetical protein